MLHQILSRPKPGMAAVRYPQMHKIGCICSRQLVNVQYGLTHPTFLLPCKSYFHYGRPSPQLGSSTYNIITFFSSPRIVVSNARCTHEKTNMRTLFHRDFRCYVTCTSMRCTDKLISAVLWYIAAKKYVDAACPDFPLYICSQYFLTCTMPKCVGYSKLSLVTSILCAHGILRPYR